jgi:hypothetical protein
VNFIQVPHGGWFCHELSNAVVKRTINEQIRTLTFGATFVSERRPFAKNSRRVEINVRVDTSHHLEDDGSLSRLSRSLLMAVSSVNTMGSANV